jgi:hypothetical protein
VKTAKLGRILFIFIYSFLGRRIGWWWVQKLQTWKDFFCEEFGRGCKTANLEACVLVKISGVLSAN